MQLPTTATLQETSALVRDVQDALAALASQGPGAALELDASALATFDTSVIALLLQARRLAQAEGRGFQVRGAPGKLVQLAQLYGVESLLGFASSGSSREAAT